MNYNINLIISGVNLLLQFTHLLSYKKLKKKENYLYFELLQFIKIKNLSTVILKKPEKIINFYDVLGF